jgi:hypothetical protein
MIEISFSTGFYNQLERSPLLHALIEDFINYLKGDLQFNGLGEIGYLNAQYLFGRDVPFDRDPVKILGFDYPSDYAGTCNHIHLIDRTLTDATEDQAKTYAQLIGKNHTKNNQNQWTSNCFLVYYRHSMKSDSYVVLDFWIRGHDNFSHNTKQKLKNMIDAYENGDYTKKILSAR